jgi:hypothetical protein
MKEEDFDNILKSKGFLAIKHILLRKTQNPQRRIIYESVHLLEW